MNDTLFMVANFVSTDFHLMQEDYKQYIIENRKRKIAHKSVWRNDIVQFGVVVCSLEKPLHNVSFQFNALKSEAGDVIAVSNISVQAIRRTKAYIGRGGSWNDESKKEMVPDILDDTLPQTIAAEYAQMYWITVNVNEDIAADLFLGEFRILSDEHPEGIMLELAVEVLPMTLPETNFGLELWQYPYTAARYYSIAEKDLFGEQHCDILKKHFSAYRQAGGDTISVTIVEDPWNTQTYDPYPSMIKWTKTRNGDFVFDYSHFDTYVTLAMDCGVKGHIKSFSMVPWKNRIIYFDERKNKMVSLTPRVGGRRWRNLWATFLDSYVKHLDEKGWFDITYIAMDERPLRIMKPVIDLLSQHPNKEGKRLKISGAMDYNKISADVLNEIEDISIALIDIDIEGDALRQLARDRRNKGMRTTMYTCVGHYPNSFARSQPVESTWTMWYALSQELDGYLRWALDAWVENPLRDISYKFWEAGDPFLIYPNDKDGADFTSRSTPRFEHMKEGLRDINKVRYLMQQDESIKQELFELLTSLKRPTGKKNAYGAMVSGSVENDNLVKSEVARMQEALLEITRKHCQ